MFLRLIAIACLLAIGSWGAEAAGDYPNRSVRIIVPFGPGGGTDILARIITRHVPERLGQEMIIENKGGGGSAIGTVKAVHSPNDGYTLLFQSSALTINTALYDDLPYDPIKDLDPISLLASGPIVLVVHPSTKVKSLDELLARAKKAPGTLTFATGGQGSSPHLGLEQLMSATGTKFVPVHYKGSGPAVKDLLGGHVGIMFAGISQSRTHIDSGALIALAVTRDKRNPALPNVPTLKELGYGTVTAGSYWGALAPKGTPKEIIDRLSGIFAEVMRIPSVIKRLEGLGYISIGSTPEEYAKNIRSEIVRWTAVVKKAGISKKKKK